MQTQDRRLRPAAEESTRIRSAAVAVSAQDPLGSGSHEREAGRMLAGLDACGRKCVERRHASEVFGGFCICMTGFCICMAGSCICMTGLCVFCTTGFCICMAGFASA